MGGTCIVLGGQILRTFRWDVIVDLFFYRDRVKVGKDDETPCNQHEGETEENGPNVIGNMIAAAPVSIEDAIWDTREIRTRMLLSKLKTGEVLNRYSSLGLLIP